MVVRPNGLIYKILFMNNASLKKHLQAIDITDKQITIFLFLLKNGPKSSTQIAKKLDIPKTTVYRQLHNLITRGIITVEKSERGDVFRANSAIIKEEIQEKYNSIKSSYTKIAEIDKTLNSLVNLQTPSPTLKCYEGIDGIKQMVWNTLKTKGMLYFYSNANRRRLLGDKWFKRYLEEFTSSNIYEKGFEIIKDTKYYPNNEFNIYPQFLKQTEIKFVDEIKINGEITIYNDTYSMFNFENEKYWGFEIRDQNFTTVQKSIFEKLWKTMGYEAYYKRGKFTK